jgi:phage/plasmid-associated DNA primase
MPLKKLRLAIVDESSRNDQLAADNFKLIAAGEEKSGRDLNEKEGVLKFFCKGIVCTNEIPKFDGSDQALIDRMVCVPFDARFCQNPTKENEFKMDPSLKERVKDGYLAEEFLAWAVRGAIRGYADGWDFSCESINSQTNNILMEEDPVQLFINEQCNTSGEVSVQDFREAYSSFLVDLGFDENKIPASVVISKILKKKGYQLSRNNTARMYVGISLRDPGSNEQNTENNEATLSDSE